MHYLAERYFDDLAAILGLAPGVKNLVCELAQIINADGIIVLKKEIKRELASKLDITAGTFDNSLSKLLQTQTIKRIERGVFEANSYLFPPKKAPENTSLRLILTYVSDSERKIEGNFIH
jgi:hypothetical protein